MTDQISLTELQRVLTAKGVSKALQDSFFANRHHDMTVDELIASNAEVGYWLEGDDYNLYDDEDEDEDTADERVYYCQLSIEVDDEPSVNEFCKQLRRTEQRLRGEFNSVESVHVSFDNEELTICAMGVALPDLRKYAILSGFTAWLAGQQDRLMNLREQRAELQTLTNQAEELAALLEEN